MATTAKHEASSKPPALPREVLAELVRDACGAVNGQLTPMVERLVAAMADMTTAGIDAQAAYRRARASNLLKNNTYAFVHLAGEAVERALREAVDALVPGAKTRADAVSLSLVPLEVMDNRVAFGTLCRPFEIAHSEVLASLCVRIGQLLGRSLLRPEQNPFRPDVFLAAIHDAWRAFAPEEEDHPLLAPLLRPELFLDLGPLLDALDAALRTRSKRARERFHISKTVDAARPRQSGMDAALARQLRSLLGAGDGEAAATLVPDLPNMPQGNGWRPSAAAGFGVAPQGAGGAAAAASPHPVAGAAAAHAYPGFVAGQGPASVPAAGFLVLPGEATPVGAGMAAPAAPGAAHPPGVPQASLLALLAGLQLPAAAAAVSSPGAPIDPAAPAHQVFYLPRFKQSLPQGSLSRGEENTLDLLARVFETVLLDDSIPPETRELIRFLQVPVLKAALRDQNFFFEEAHPARRMIDLLSHMGWEGRKGADDPVVQAMQRGVERIGRAGDGEGEGKADAGPAAFAAAVADLEAQLALEARAAEEAIAAPIARATQQEKQQQRQAVAARSARQAVRVRVADGELTATVSGFLEQRWVDVLTFAWLIEDERPGALANATRTMDELVWTVKPKATQEQRKTLIAKLPGLLAALNKWLDAIKWQDAERLQFFADLAKCHLSIVRAPLDLSPERQLELAVEAARQDALRRIAIEEAQGEDAAQETPPQDDAARTVDALERGMRLEFTQPDRSVRKVKLAWVSPLRTLFIFSHSGRQESFSLPFEKLVASLRSGSVRVVAAEGVVGRVLTEALQAVNDPAPLYAAG
ncbi:DUF1631 family protein [Massilia sp. CFBP 13647]|uniref:DUF1631 family protein n=1 Tax=Massilia sp. CFBP 13647 TaxID=2775276 RepID=UPI001780BFB1|nr:DUF1631 family protein [Massilia sp. CFBP 13647]MBD8530180.1 DUF1631 family protein [Massilia sp. CFBP 13647]